jgi:hypothetical protein
MAGKKTYNLCLLQMNVATFILLFFLQLFTHYSFAQEQKTATIKLDFIGTDSTKVCRATVMSDGKPVAGPEVHLYVKRLYSLLPVGKVVATDETGVANIDFPMDLPGDKNGMLVIIAKIEKDDKYGDVETQAEMKWGFLSKKESPDWNDRSLSSSREKAPMFLVVVSNLIIVIIWVTIFYIFFQLVRIKKSGRRVKKLNTTAN